MLAGIFVGAFLYKRDKAKFEHGRHVGYINGGLHVIEQLDKHFVKQPLESTTTSNVIDVIQFKDRLIRIRKEGDILTLETL